MTQAEIAAFNSGIAMVVALAEASAAMRARLVEKPTRFNFAIEALDALASEAATLMKTPPDDSEPADAALAPRPLFLTPGIAV